MGGALLLRWIWWRLTAWGELSAILASLVLAPLLLWLMPSDAADSDATRLLIMFLGSTATSIAVSLLTGPEESERLQTFYRRARPPGFWGPVAKAAGKDPGADSRRLRSGLVAVALASASIFLLLTAIGSLLAMSPPPAWFPWRGVWISLLFAAGAALVPVWFKLAFRSADEARAEEDAATEERERPQFAKHIRTTTPDKS